MDYARRDGTNAFFSPSLSHPPTLHNLNSVSPPPPPTLGFSVGGVPPPTVPRLNAYSPTNPPPPPNRLHYYRDPHCRRGDPHTLYTAPHSRVRRLSFSKRYGQLCRIDRAAIVCHSSPGQVRGTAAFLMTLLPVGFMNLSMEAVLIFEGQIAKATDALVGPLRLAHDSASQHDSSRRFCSGEVSLLGREARSPTPVGMVTMKGPAEFREGEAAMGTPPAADTKSHRSGLTNNREEYVSPETPAFRALGGTLERRRRRTTWGMLPLTVVDHTGGKVLPNCWACPLTTLVLRIEPVNFHATARNPVQLLELGTRRLRKPLLLPPIMLHAFNKRMCTLILVK